MTDTFSLLFVAICSIVLLTYLVVVRKVHAFIAILVAAAFVGLGTGMEAADVLASMQSGMGNTLGFVATIVGLGAMFGQFYPAALIGFRKLSTINLVIRIVSGRLC